MSVPPARALSGAIALASESHSTGRRRADRRRAAALRERVWGGVWLVCVAAGLGGIVSYQMTPAEPGDPVTRWPAETSVPLATDRLTILMFVHPRCPCTRTSLNELSAVLQRAERPAAVHPIVLRTPQLDGGLAADRAARIHGLAPVPDAGGREHRIFGARTSGEVFVFRPSGELVFHGGITAGRGHAGPNAGTLALDSLLLGLSPRIGRTAIYGCALDAPSAPSRAVMADASDTTGRSHEE